jgi:hypothetical protein
MKKLIKILFITLIFFSANSYSAEIIPILGYRTGGEFVDDTTDQKHTIESSEMYGFLVSMPSERGKSYEFYYSHQSSNLNSISITTPSPTGTTNIPLTIDYFHFGGTTPISSEPDLKTYVSGGLGFTKLSPDFTGLESELRPSFSLGIGLKYPITETIAFRLETRALATMFNNNSAIFCSGGCTISVNGNFFLQGEVFAGIAFGF